MTAVPSPRVVVFDMDETLGHFVQLGGFWDSLERAHGLSLHESHFVDTLALYPEFVRPGMEVLLAQLVAARTQGDISAIIMYTNNQGPERWAQYVAAYFDHMAGARVFDMIIPAYVVRGRQVSPCRTSHAKSPDDLFRCTGLPPTTRVCFVDDQDHPPMTDCGVYYIRPPPYVATVFPTELVDRYMARHAGKLAHGFRRRLGSAMVSQRGGDFHSSLGSRAGDTTSWIRAHIGRFIDLSQPEVTRRRDRRRRSGGLTRRRRRELWWS